MSNHGTSSYPSAGMCEVPCGFSVTTEPFRATPGAYFRYSARRVIVRLGLITAVPVAAALLASLLDMRWAFVALILVFLVAPMAVAYIYFTRVLTIEAQRALSPKCVTLQPGIDLTVTYVSADEENTPLPAQAIAWQDIDSIELNGCYLTVESRMLGYPLLIPTESFPERYPYQGLCTATII
ncbi:MAG: hypothetical protein NC189_07580 [Bacteroides sp.]|nr:hypothetical protein [Bacteroides sp.]